MSKKSIKINGDKVVYFDVDDTLIHWVPKGDDSDVKVEYCEDGDVESFFVTPIWENVEALKIHASRNHTIVVWSAGGVEWAYAVVKALGISKYVDVVICKPSWIYDDLDAKDFMPKSLWGVKDPAHQEKEPVHVESEEEVEDIDAKELYYKASKKRGW